jgi:hypothetical protein
VLNAAWPFEIDGRARSIPCVQATLRERDGSADEALVVADVHMPVNGGYIAE